MRTDPQLFYVSLGKIKWTRTIWSVWVVSYIVQKII